MAQALPLGPRVCGTEEGDVWLLSWRYWAGTVAVVGTWGVSLWDFKGHHRPPALGPVCHCTELGLRSEGRNVGVLRGSMAPTPCKARLPPAQRVPGGLGGRAWGEAPSLCPHPTQGPFDVPEQVAAATWPVSFPSPHRTRRENGRKMRYLPRPAQAWPLQRKGRAVIQGDPQSGPHTCRPQQPQGW